jgi:hypothetical protein
MARGYVGPLCALYVVETPPPMTEFPETRKQNSGPEDPHLINLVLFEYVLQHFEVG